MRAIGASGTPVRYLAREVKDLNLNLEERNLLSLSYGRIIRKDIESKEGLLPANFERYTVVLPGDVVLRLTDLQNDQRSLRTGLVKESGIITSAYLTLRPQSTVDSRYFAYALHALDVAKVFYTLGGGLRQSMGMEEVGGLRLALPPPEEQRRIADFLDDHVARVDQATNLKGAESQSLAVLSETLLTEAYDTQSSSFGLARFRLGVKLIRQGWSPQCEDRLPEGLDWGVLRAGCVNNGVFRPDDVKALPVDVIPRTEFLVSVGDLLINRASGSVDLIGSCALVGEDLRPRTLLCDKVYKVVLNGRWLPEYVVQMWRTRQVREALRLGVSGAEGMANSLPSSVIMSIRLPLLPVDSQRTWAEESSKADAQVAKCLGALDKSRELLRDYKHSLITAAVTGELDVTTARRGIPA